MRPGAQYKLSAPVNRTSSIWNPSNLTLVLYQGAYFDGKSATVAAHVPCLSKVLDAAGFATVGSVKVYSGARILGAARA